MPMLGWLAILYLYVLGGILLYRELTGAYMSMRSLWGSGHNLHWDEWGAVILWPLLPVILLAQVPFVWWRKRRREKEREAYRREYENSPRGQAGFSENEWI